MNDQEFVDAALIAIAASLATVQQPSLNEYDSSRGRTRMMPVDEVVARAHSIVDGLVKVRGALIKVKT